MALTDKEKRLMQQVKDKGGKADDFREALNELRKRETAPVTEEAEQVEVTETTTEVSPDLNIFEQQAQVSTSTGEAPDTAFLGDLVRASQEQTVQQEEVAADIESEKEEGLKGFISEAGEALKERGVRIGEILEQEQQKSAVRQEEIKKTFQEEGVGAGLKAQFADILKNTIPGKVIETNRAFLTDEQATDTQIAGQIAGAVTDTVFEGVENLIQEFTPEQVEDAIEGALSTIGESEEVQEIATSYADFKERNPERAANIEAVVNIGALIPVTKVGQLATKPLSKTAQQATKKAAEQSVKDLSRGLLNIPGKTATTKELTLGKFFAKNLDPVDNFDDVVEQFSKLGKDSIKQVDDSLKSVTKTFKPQGAKEVLDVIQENLKKIPFATTQKKTVTDLIKKFQGEGLTLTDLNKIKRSINEYTRAWTAAGRDAAGLAPESLRTKYSEIMKFIENTAKREGLPDIRELNQNWIKSNEIFELLSKQATSVGKKKGIQAIQGTTLLKKLGTKVRQIREDLGLSDLPGAQGLEDIDLKKAFETLKRAAASSEKVPLLESLRKTISGGKKGSGLDKVKATSSAVDDLGLNKINRVLDDLSNKSSTQKAEIVKRARLKRTALEKQEIAKIADNIKKEPNLVFHGTNQQFDKFIQSKAATGIGNKFGEGIYLTTDPQVARQYAKAISGFRGGKARLVEAVIPDEISIFEHKGGLDTLLETANKAKQAGFKGIKYIDNKAAGASPNYLIFDTTDIQILKNAAINRLGPEKGLALLSGLLAGGVGVGTGVSIGDTINELLDFLSQSKEDQLTNL